MRAQQSSLWHHKPDVTVALFKRAKFFAIFFPLVLALTGCLPEEVPFIEALKKDGISYEGFQGIDSAVTVNGSRVTISWTPSTDSRVVAYNIYDATFRFQPRLIRTVTAPANAVTLSGLSAQSLYSFRVRAADADNKEDSNAKDIRAIPYNGLATAEVVSSTSVRLTFAEATNSDQILIYCKTNLAPTYVETASVRNTSALSVLIADLSPGVEYTCRAALEINGFVDNNENTKTFSPMGQADKLVFGVQPGNGAAGQPLSTQPIVRILDENNNLVAGGPDATAIVDLTLADNSPTPGSVKGVISVQAVGGIATFSGINLEESGQKIIKAVKQDTSSTVFGTASMSIGSSPFLITAGVVSADNSSITISPEVPPAEPLTANGTESYAVKIKLRDAFNNPIVGIRPTFSSNVIGDTLSQPATNTNASGETTGSLSSTIADLAPNLRRLAIASPSGLSGVTVLAPMKPGVATKIAYFVQPVNSPAGNLGMAPITLEVQDAQGNRVRTGDASTSTVTISIASNINGAILSGSFSKDMVAGVASFNDLGIDRTGTGYRIIASAGSLSPAYSNTFNITAGVPRKLAVNGPTSVTSGLCSTAITIQLQDLGNNPTNAIQSTPVTLSGLGSGAFFSSQTCGGSPLGSSLTFTAGTNSRTVYFRSQKAELVNISIADTSSVLSVGTLSLRVHPAKLGLLAQAASPAPPLTPLRVVAGRCSTEIIITPMGADGNPGPTFIPTAVTVSGILGSQATLFSDAECTQGISASNTILPINSGPNFSYKMYLKDDKSESFSISVADNAAMMTTTTSPQPVVVAPSNLSFTGPTSVVAGRCSSVFSIQLRDVLGAATEATADRTLTINGIPGTSVGRFYTSSTCTGPGQRTTLTFPEGSDTLQVYFRSVVSDVLTLSISDPATEMTTSSSIVLSVSPSALRIVAPGAGNALTNICAGPFNVQTLDGVANQTNAVGPITANLTGQGDSGGFFSDSNCTAGISSVTFSSGQNQRPFYFRGFFPEASLSLTATDAAAVLTAGSRAWTVLPAKGWLGTASSRFDGASQELWFRIGAKAVAARNDGVFSSSSLSFSPDFRYLYVADSDQHRIVKYDYTNQRYVGWIGRFWNNGGIGVAGSTLTTPSTAACVSTLSGSAVPGWCVNGQSTNDGSAAAGGLGSPSDIKDDGTYLYVANQWSQTVSRFNSNTGSFEGYLGIVNSPTGLTAAEGGPGSCSTTTNGNPTPGWCRGGSSGAWASNSAGRFNNPRSISFDDDYLYVSHDTAINRYDKATGAFAGWIGMVQTQPTGGASGCSTRNQDQMTPGWCLGGASKGANPLNHFSQIGGLNGPRDMVILGEELIVFHHVGQNVRYNKSTGAVVGVLPSLTPNWFSIRQVATDGTRIFFTDSQRLVQTDLSGLIQGWMGKVANNLSMSGDNGCGSLAINANTPGWCLGGTSRPGTDATSFRNLESIAYDGNGKILVGQGGGSGNIRRFDATTGAYEGMLALESVSPKKWSNDVNLATERHGFDDDSMFNPEGVVIAGDFLFMTELSSSRVKKFNRKTGQLLGWIGAITSSPTGGPAGCIGANPFAAAPNWCLGANFLPSSLFWTTSMINSTSNGIFLSPVGITADATYVYVTDRDLHRISRFRITDGAPEGWIGRISVSPTGGDAGCNGAAVDSFTPGWCTGGRSREGSGNGALYHPGGITTTGGVLYVVDTVNRRISSYNSATGAFNGWIGRVATAPSSGCTTVNRGSGYDVVNTGWCRGGTSTESNSSDRGGGFRFWHEWRGGISTDGTHLYVSNFHNVRIDKFTLAGAFVSSTRAREDMYTNNWSTDPAVISAMGANQCSYPLSTWSDANFMYGVSADPCSRVGDSFNVWKMNLSTGQMVGWQGGIDPSNLPNDGEVGSNCAGATTATPGWCRGGRTMLGLRMGQFSGRRGSITGDSHFIYVTDQTGNRITRIPK